MHVRKPDAAERPALIERAIAEDLALRLRLDPPEGHERPSYGEIYRAAVLDDALGRDRVERAAKLDPWVARSYSEALGREALAAFGEVAAAHTGVVLTRHSGPYAVEVRPSQSRSDRTFLIITFASSAPPPRRLKVHPMPEKEEVRDLDLPAAAEGAIQVILPRAHPVIRAVQDPERQFHLS